MKAQGVPAHKIFDCVRNFDPTVSVGEYQNTSVNQHLVQSKAFSSFRALQAAWDDSQSEKDPKKKLKKKISISINARFVLANLKANDILLLDATKKNFVNALEFFSLPISEDKENHNSVLASIRGNCLFSAQLYLAQEKAPKTKSLQALSTQKDEECTKREISPKELERIIRLCRTSKSEVELIKNEANLPLTYSCFHCNSSVCAETMKPEELEEFMRKAQEKTEGGATYVNPVFACFNVLKATPLENLQVIELCQNIRAVTDNYFLT